MAKDDNGAVDVTAADSPGAQLATSDASTAVVTRDSLVNPGFPPHRPRITDLDHKEERKA